MPKKVLRLKATIDETDSSIELLEIKGIAPFSVTSFCRREGIIDYIKIEVRNGNQDGCGLSSLNVNYTPVIQVFNGKDKGVRSQKIPISTSPGFGTREPKIKLFLVKLYAIRRALENKFIHTNVEFSFEITSNLEGRAKKIHLTSYYQSAGILVFETLENSAPLTNNRNLTNFIERKPEAFIMQSDQKIFILLHKIELTELQSIRYDLMEQRHYIWCLPNVDSKGNTYSSELDMDILIDKVENTTGKNYFSLGFHINKYYGNGDFGRLPLSAQPGGLIGGVWMPQSHSGGVYYATANKYRSEIRSFLTIPGLPCSVRNKKVKDIPGVAPWKMENEKRLDWSMSFTEIKETLRNIRNSLELIKDTCKMDINVLINGNTIPLEDFINKNANSIRITHYINPSVENIQLNMNGYFTVSDEIMDKFKEMGEFTLEHEGRKLDVNLNAKVQRTDKDVFHLKIQKGKDASFKINQRSSDCKKVEEIYSFLWDTIVYNLGGLLEIVIKEEESFALPKTKRCTPDDYIFSVGCEYETGVTNIKVQNGNGAASKTGVVYGHCTDGGGVELKTVIMDNPNVFAYVAKFDAMCKSIRDCGYKPKVCASTHIHMSLNLPPKIDVPKGKKTQEVNPSWFGNAMFRRTLIGSNWYALLNKYTIALTFLDTFNQGGRRSSNYGSPIMISKTVGGGKKIVFHDKRFTDLKGEKYEKLQNCTGRNSLLRTNTNNIKLMHNIHWEYRGTDACPSSIFMGLKIEFMQAIAKQAIHLAMEGVHLDIWDKKVWDEIDDLAHVESVFHITDKIGRKKAANAIKELKQWLTPAAFKGLRAWVTFVDIHRADTGTVKWFEDMEAILVTKIGPKNFVTDDDLEKMFEYSSASKCYVPKEGSKSSKTDNVKQVVPTSLLTGTATGATSSTGYITRTNCCHKCGAYTGGYPNNVKGLTLCVRCRREEEAFSSVKITQAKEYAPPKNQATKTKELISSIVTKALSYGD